MTRTGSGSAKAGDEVELRPSRRVDQLVGERGDVGREAGDRGGR